MNTKKIRLIKLAYAGVVLLLCIFLYHVCDWVLTKELIQKNILGEDGRVKENNFGTKINYWRVSQNSPNYTHYWGIDSNLQKVHPGVQTESHGFITENGKELQLEKAPNTVRIFLLGGSAAFGCYQTRSVIPDSSYPEGIATYENSIAGRLKAILQKKNLGTLFEVVNCAEIGYQFNQNVALYVSILQQYHPDIVINLDGYNDDGLSTDFMHGGDPYGSAVEGQAEVYVELNMINRSARVGKLLMYINSFCLQENPTEQDRPTLKMVSKIIKSIFSKHFLVLKRLYTTSITAKDLPVDSFRNIDAIMRKNMRIQMQLYDTYSKMLQAQRVHEIFCYQPMLQRETMQKELSVTEKKLLATLKTSYHCLHEKMALDTMILSAMNMPKDAQQAFNAMGEAKYYTKEYHYKHFINEYISPTVDSIVRNSGGEYIDMNKAMMTLPSTKEVYVDYCHLTPFGSQFVAEQMAEKVQTYIYTK